ncbi:MAG: TlpA disulfide reductase family protein [Thiotrichaceae bacterium]
MPIKFKVTLTTIILFTLSFLSTGATAMTDMKGNPSTVSSHVGKGKWLIVEAWHSECGTCKKTMPELVKSKGTFPNAKLIGVSLDGNKSKAQRFIDRFKVNFPTILTNRAEFDKYVRKVAKKPMVGAPTYLIFAPNGELKAMQSGNISPKDIKSYIKSQ